MTATLTFNQEISLGFKAMKLRVSLGLTRQELADLAGVSLGEVDLFEHSLPVQLNTKRALLKELWAKKANA